MESLIATLEEKRQKVRAGGGEKQIERQHKSGKLTARERLERLLDGGSFIEYDAWLKNRCTDFGYQDQEFPGEGCVIGCGDINNNKVFIFSQDFTLLGGSLGEAQGTKVIRLWDKAMAVGAPVIGINDSGGARVQEGMGSMHGYCAFFAKNSIASGWIPQISVILGPCAGGAVYSPALTDFIIMVNKLSRMFITGPLVIEAVTGEKIDQESLGGAAVHSQKTGVAHFVVDTEEEAFALIKRLLSFLPQNSKQQPPRIVNTDPIDRETVKIQEIIPVDNTRSYDVKDVIRDMVDNADFLEVHENFATNMVVGFARMDGQSVGIVASQTKSVAGCLDVDASCKAARFVRFCDAFNIPLIIMADTPGYLPGTDQEYKGIIRHGAKLLYAFSEATVPKITLVLRKSYGGAYSAMCGMGLGADVVLALPTSEIAVMGAEGAANIVFAKEIKAAQDPVAKRAEMVKSYNDKFVTPYRPAEYGIVNEIITPKEVRYSIIKYLKMMEGKTEARPYKKHCNLPL